MTAKQQLEFEKIISVVKDELTKADRPLYPSEIAAKLADRRWLADTIRDAVFALRNRGEVEIRHDSRVELKVTPNG